jgi:hypothetical protein
MNLHPDSARIPGAGRAHRASLSRKAPAMAAAALLGLSACMTSSDDKDPAASSTDKGFLFTVTSDFATGSYSVLGIDSAFKQNNIDPINGDAGVRYLGGNDIFILNRSGRDNIQVVDRHNLKTVLQFKVDANSNPQDIALKDGKLYVAFLGADSIGIYDQEDGKALGKIDLSAYADSSDKLPETADVEFVDGTLYALTQNLKTDDNSYKPLTAHLIKIDVAAKKAIKALELPYGNPASISYDSAAGKFYIPCSGELFNEDFSAKLDAGIVTVDLARFEIGEDVATEQDLGGNPRNAILYKGKLYMDVNGDTGDKVVAVSVSGGKVEEIVKLDEPWSVGGMAIDAKSSTLFVGDRKKDAARLRIFDADTFKERDDSKIDLGMPAYDMVVVR